MAQIKAKSLSAWGACVASPQSGEIQETEDESQHHNSSPAIHVPTTSVSAIAWIFASHASLCVLPYRIVPQFA